MINEQKNRAIRTLEKLRDNLQAYVDKDPEQDVTGIAISAVDAVVADARQYVDEDDPVLASIAEGHLSRHD